MSKGKTLLVTGASSGIGLQLARIGAKRGYDLILVANNKHNLEYVAGQLAEHFGVGVTALAQDLSASGAVASLCLHLVDRRIDVLINCAGFGDYNEFAVADSRRLSDMIRVNVLALTELTRWVLPQMVERSSGVVMNIASTAGFLSGPLMATYYATKNYVLSLSEAIDQELRGTGVRVMTVCPGPTATGFEQAAHLEESSLFKAPGIMGAEAVAEAAWRGLDRGQGLVIPGWRNRVQIWVVRFLPRRLVTWVVYHAQKRVP
jgi:uncharacterized protein